MTFTVREAKNRFSELLDLFEEGEEIVIERRGHAVARAAAEKLTFLGGDDQIRRYSIKTVW